jgi:hypothetical protein
MRYTPSSEPTLGKTQADFSYSIRGEVISIIDLDLGNRSVTNDIENVLRKIRPKEGGDRSLTITAYWKAAILFGSSRTCGVSFRSFNV